MNRMYRWRWLLGVCLATALCWGTAADAADKAKVDRATEQVEQGAKEIGQGDVGRGFKKMFTGIGHTIVEGAKFTGNTLEEFFKRAFRD